MAGRGQGELLKVKGPVFGVGDLHGNFGWIAPWLEWTDLSRCTLIFCGDIGLGFYRDGFIKSVAQDTHLPELLKERRIRLLFFRGNHDDPSKFASRRSLFAGGTVIPDYTLVYNESDSILCVGGAVSLDRSYRRFAFEEAVKSTASRQNITLDLARSYVPKQWWENEGPIENRAHMYKLNHNIVKYGISFASIVMSHSGPSAAPPYGGLPRDWVRADGKLEGDVREERKTLDGILECVTELRGSPPIKWCYGHYHSHQRQLVGQTDYIMLDMAREGRFDTALLSQG